MAKKKGTGFWADFKKFISRGNVIDLAVGVIIGGAFSAIVTALTSKIIMPLINLLLSAGGENGLEKAYTYLKVVYDADGGIDLAKSIYIDWGAFITAVIDFFLIALVLFLILRAVMRASNAYQATRTLATNKDLKAERKAVREQAKAEGKSFKVAWAEHKAKQAEEDAKRQAEEEANKPIIESQEDILKDIRELLKAQNAKK